VAYVIGIPLAAVFVFVIGMGLSGMWFGIAIAYLILVVTIHKKINNADWESISVNKVHIKNRK
jgi:Na+-driven multidrug efflux pump